MTTTLETIEGGGRMSDAAIHGLTLLAFDLIEAEDRAAAESEARHDRKRH